jgi:predicted NACHT family NTPase
LAEHSLQADLQAQNIDVRREFYEFATVFITVAKRTRTPAEILANQKLESLHRQLGNLQERLNRLPTIEGMRTEMARLAGQELLTLPGRLSPTFSADRCQAFALAQQMRGWFETLGFRFEAHEVWQDDYFEWIINIPVRRGRYDRILVRGIDGEAGLRDVEALKQSVETHRTDEGWLVTARRISRAARDEVEKAENGLGCYTLDELLDQDADFGGYLTWLETEIQKRGIDQTYVPWPASKKKSTPTPNSAWASVGMAIATAGLTATSTSGWMTRPRNTSPCWGSSARAKPGLPCTMPGKPSSATAKPNAGG